MHFLTYTTCQMRAQQDSMPLALTCSKDYSRIVLPTEMIARQQQTTNRQTRITISYKPGGKCIVVASSLGFVPIIRCLCTNPQIKTSCPDSGHVTATWNVIQQFRRLLFGNLPPCSVVVNMKRLRLHASRAIDVAGDMVSDYMH